MTVDHTLPRHSSEHPADPTADGRTDDVAAGTAGAGSATLHDVPPSAESVSATSRGTGVARSRAATTWVGVVVSALLLIALIVFIAQNQGRVTTRFLGFDGSLSLGLTVLVSAVVGALLTAIPASIRIIQLRRNLTHARK